MRAKAGIVVFPGSNCDRDIYHALLEMETFDVSYIWHEEKQIPDVDVIFLPGGFSYGDYLRAGAMAKLSPIMDTIHKMANMGKIIIGICNGFQILTEAGLLPGALLKNTSGLFVCKTVKLRVVSTRTPFTMSLSPGEIIELPIAHGDGRYYVDDDTLAKLKNNDQILFRYEGENPNGSIDNIAGVCNKNGNVIGMMPHPERAVSPYLKNTHGRKLFASLTKYIKEYEFA